MSSAWSKGSKPLSVEKVPNRYVARLSIFGKDVDVEFLTEEDAWEAVTTWRDHFDAQCNFFSDVFVCGMDGFLVALTAAGCDDHIIAKALEVIKEKY